MEIDTVKFTRARDYKVVRSVDQGGLGKTILLWDDIINEQFLCKKYSPILPEHRETYFSNFINEIKLLHLINHRNIVRVYNYYLYPDRITGYLLMEFIEGKNIRDYAIAHRENINDIFIQSLEGFNYLELNNILHRDIRPENILISNDHVLKIIDFGFGKNVATIEEFDNSVNVTARYPKPDEYSVNVYDFRTEVYYLGCLFHEIIEENGIENFAFTKILNKMIIKDYDERIDSFSKVLREIDESRFQFVKFSQKEKNIYREFANALRFIFNVIYIEYQYIDDIDLIISNLKILHSGSLLEKYIQNNSKLGNCFIRGGYNYKSSETIEVSVLENFLEMFSSMQSIQQKIILNHLWNRLDTIPKKRKEDDSDLPF